jgi:hypothetical protein
LKPKVTDDCLAGLNSIKSDLFDLVSDFREKFRPDEQLKRKYDALIKEMVMGVNFSHELNNLSVLKTATDLIKQFLELIRDNFWHQQVSEKKVEKQTEQETFNAGERVIRKRIEIVLQVFRAASERLTRIDREWQEVLDA